MKDKDLHAAPTEDCYGFYGTIQSNEELSEADAIKAWESAMETLTLMGHKPMLARNFLRNRMGRHFADATSFYEGTLADRIQQASGENWVAQEIKKLKRDGYDKTLFECDPLK